MSPKKTKRVVHGALIGIKSSIILFVGVLLLLAARITNVRSMEPNRKENRRRLNGIGKSVDILGIIEVFFHYAG